MNIYHALHTRWSFLEDTIGHYHDHYSQCDSAKESICENFCLTGRPRDMEFYLAEIDKIVGQLDEMVATIGSVYEELGMDIDARPLTEQQKLLIQFNTICTVLHDYFQIEDCDKPEKVSEEYYEERARLTKIADELEEKLNVHD